MSMRQLFSANRKAKGYTSNVTKTPLHNLPGRDSETLPDETESAESTTAPPHNLPGRDPETLSSLSDSTLGDANYIYYRMYAEDGAIPSKTSAARGDPFLGRIKATSVPPPHTIHNVRCSIARAEGIEDPAKTSLFLTPYNQSAMRDTDKVTILNCNDVLGSTPQKPLALVARISDSERSVLESGVAAEHDTSTTPLKIRYLYYRLYAEDGAIPSKTSAARGNPFLGRIKATSVSPPHTVKNVICHIAKVEGIKDPTQSSLFLTPYCQSHMRDTDKLILNRIGLGSTPQEPLAIVAKISDSKRRVLESEVAADLEPRASTTPQEIRYLYYLLYANDNEKPSKVAFDPEKPSLGRIRADSIAPPHSPATIKQCISRAERTPALAYADIFLDVSSDTPLKDHRHISIFRTDCPGLSQKKPMAISLEPSLRDGRYFIKNRAADIYWWADSENKDSGWTLKFTPTLNFLSKIGFNMQFVIAHDSNGNISMKSRAARNLWIGVDTESAQIELSKVSIPWRFIRVDSKFYYLTTNVNNVSGNSGPQVPVPVATVQPDFTVPVLMTNMKEGDQWQMWEFIRI